MKIITPSDFFEVIGNNHLLLDTCVFIDASLHPGEFTDLFSKMRSSGVTLVTLDSVKAEFFKGAPNRNKLKDKEKIVDDIIKTCLTVDDITYNNTFELIKRYLQDGASLSITDFLLGATLLKHPKNLMLLTKNTTEFPISIFDLKTYFNILYNKGLHTYGVYTRKS